MYHGFIDIYHILYIMDHISYIMYHYIIDHGFRYAYVYSYYIYQSCQPADPSPLLFQGIASSRINILFFSIQKVSCFSGPMVRPFWKLAQCSFWNAHSPKCGLSQIVMDTQMHVSGMRNCNFCLPHVQNAQPYRNICCHRLSLQKWVPKCLNQNPQTSHNRQAQYLTQGRPTHFITDFKTICGQGFVGRCWVGFWDGFCVRVWG